MRDGAKTTTEIVEAFPEMTRHAVMKHIDVLRAAALINTTKDGRKRENSLNPVPIRDIYERWMGPFAELWQAQNGREVVIADSAGKEFRFRIKQIETVRKEELPARAVEFFGPRGPHRLVLVTCGGTWIGGQQGYEANRVVIAEPVG